MKRLFERPLFSVVPAVVVSLALAGSVVAQPAPTAKPTAGPTAKPTAGPTAKPAGKPAPKPEPKPVEKPAEPKPAEKPAEPKPVEKPAEPKPADPPAVVPVTATPPATGGAADEDAPPDPAKRGEAEEHFKKGLQLLAEDAWQAALAEFLLSRELFPTRTALNNAAFCMRKLKRFDESLDLYEALLREYPTQSADKKAAAQKEVAELRTLVGTIDVIGAEPGASILVDGKARADYPLIDPLRVSAGTHSVRLFKQGFQPFETTLEIAGGQTAKVDAKMPALVASGTLKVSEKNGLKLDVLLDGAVVGVTPWEGTVATGDHVIQLLGDGDQGTMPTAAPVAKDELSTLTLVAEPLEAGLIVNVKPLSASVRLDGVTVGRGVFDGRLRTGKHTVEVLAEGYFPKRQEVTVERGDRGELKFELERDESADAWRVPSKIVFDVTGGVALTPTLGGDVAASCAEGCAQSLGFGGMVMINGTYEFGSGFGLGLSAGIMQASQSFEERGTSLTPVGLDGLSGSANDDLRLRGVLAGAHASYRLGEQFPIRFRLGGGALISDARAVRSGTFATRSGGSFDAPALESSSLSTFIYVDPEVSIGYRLTETFEVGVGVQGVVLITPSAPTWGGDENPTLNVTGDGISSYDADETTFGTTGLIVPGVSARASF